MEHFWAAALDWANDSRIIVILGLIALDLVLGVAAALKRKEFDWRKLGDFYLTTVTPKLIGYIALHIVIGTITGVDSYVADGAQWAAFALLTASILGSAAANFRDIYGQDLPLVDKG